MNAHQRRKSWRRIERTTRSGSQHRLVRHWADLAELPESETHRLEIEVKNCNGWIKDKRKPDALGHYLSTHTFYGSQHERSTQLLRECGWNVTCANWDMPNAVALPTATLASASGSAKITQRQLESILINEGIIQAAAIENPEAYDGGRTELAVTIATQQINDLLSPNALLSGTAAESRKQSET